jgi:autotransporter-associated beta strand protein
LDKLGQGSLTLTGENTYAGETRVDAGSLVLDGVARLGEGLYGGAIRLSGGASLELNTSQAQTLGGVISGAGALVKGKANSTLTLTGENTYTGETMIAGGLLRVGNGGASGSLGTGMLSMGDGVDLVVHKINGVNVRNATIVGSGRISVQSDRGDVVIDSKIGLTGINSTLRVLASAGNVNLKPGTIIRVDGKSPASAVGAIHIEAQTFTNNAGASAFELPSPNARWLVHTQSPEFDTKGGVNYQFKQYGVDPQTAPLQEAGNGFLYQVTPLVNVSLQGVTRVYDKTDLATPGDGNFSYSGNLLDGDKITALRPMTNMPGYGAKYAGIHAVNQVVTVNNAQFETTDAVGAKVYGYVSTQGRTVVGKGSITPFMLDRAFDVITKIYDGSTTANVVANPTLGPLFAGDVVGATYASADYNSKDVVSANQVTVLGGTLIGSDARNYSISPITRINAVIVPKTVSLSASKIYDGLTDLSGSVDLQTGVGKEVLGYTGAVASDAHVSASNKYIAAISLADGASALKSNYRLPTLNSTNAPALVRARPITGQATVDGEFDKIFNNDVDVDPKKVSLIGQVNGAIAGDELTLDFSTVSLAYLSRQVGSTQIEAQGLAGFNLLRSNLLSQRSDYAFAPPVIDNVLARINSAFTVPPVATLAVVPVPQMATPLDTLVLVQVPQNFAPVSSPTVSGLLAPAAPPTALPVATPAAGAASGSAGSSGTIGSSGATGASGSPGSTEPTVQLRAPVEAAVEVRTELSPSAGNNPVEIRPIQAVELGGANSVNGQVLVPEPGVAGPAVEITGQSQLIRAQTAPGDAVEIRQVTPLSPSTNVQNLTPVQIQPN